VHSSLYYRKQLRNQSVVQLPNNILQYRVTCPHLDAKQRQTITERGKRCNLSAGQLYAESTRTETKLGFRTLVKPIPVGSYRKNAHSEIIAAKYLTIVVTTKVTIEDKR
jgi:hypothetical protein